MPDPHDLQRFLTAQDPVYQQVRDELRQGRKQSHWMWFVFPQLRGLGRSATASFYGIASQAEAEAYLNHPILGARLRECTELVNQIEGRSAHDIFGFPDELKFRSSMTLFMLMTPDDRLFRYTIEKYYDGQADPDTVHALE
jgi:uncharacterized protein (DUF1810 family)